MPTKIKRSILRIENIRTTCSKDKSEVLQFLREEDYSALGTFFWRSMLLERGKRRRFIFKAWKALSKAEQDQCEA